MPCRAAREMRRQLAELLEMRRPETEEWAEGVPTDVIEGALREPAAITTSTEKRDIKLEKFYMALLIRLGRDRHYCKY